MKKNRNAFFSESNMNLMNYNNPMVAGQYQALNTNNTMYSGPMPNNNISYLLDDFGLRLAKIERQINRLDHRISKLESLGAKTTDDYEEINNIHII